LFGINFGVLDENWKWAKSRYWRDDAERRTVMTQSRGTDHHGKFPQQRAAEEFFQHFSERQPKKICGASLRWADGDICPYGVRDGILFLARLRRTLPFSDA
jgi:hypothetical protein